MTAEPSPRHRTVARRPLADYAVDDGPLPPPPPDDWYGTAEVPFGTHDAAPNGERPTGHEPLRMYSLAELAELPAPEWRIVGVLPDESFTLLYGPSRSLKSFVAIDWCLSVAAGIPWQGHEAVQGAVLYIAAEGGGGIRRRAAAWLATHTGADVSDRFHVIPHRVDLADPTSLKRLEATVREYTQRLDEPPALIVIDTWSRNTPGVDENSSEKQSKLIDALFDGMAKRHRCGVIVVHHSGVAAGRERGSTALPGAADCRWMTKRDGAEVTLTCQKLKEWAEPDKVELRSHVVKLDADEYGSQWDPDPSSLVLLLKDPVTVDEHERHREVADMLRAFGHPVATRGLAEVLGMKAEDARERAKAAADCHECDVESWREGPAKLFAHSADRERFNTTPTAL